MPTAPPAPPSPDPWEGVRVAGRGPADHQARLAVHHALQPVAAVGQSLAPRADDDSQQSLSAGGPGRWLGAPVAGGALRAGLEAVGLELQLCDGAGGVLSSFPLGGRTLAEGLDFLRIELGRRGEAAGGLALPVHPADFPRHAIGAGAAFPAGGEAQRQGLAKLFDGTGEVLAALGRELAGPVRLWPHHFDLAGNARVGAVTVGLGFSPGDGTEGEPYWYATLWPRPGGPSLPPLQGRGSWRTEGWFGAELPLARLAPVGRERRGQVAAFYRSALEAARSA